MACDVSVKLSAFSNFAEKTNYLDPVVTAHSTGDGTVDHVRNFSIAFAVAARRMPRSSRRLPRPTRRISATWRCVDGRCSKSADLLG